MNTNFTPIKGKKLNHGPKFKFYNVLDEDLKKMDRELELKYIINYINRSKFSAELERGFVKLLSPFDPTNTGGDTLTTGSHTTGMNFR
ncbi:MAG: hypothetical protein CM1200mP10_10110 [Candidatus Neomarinimicrobiota bacterium]|nr:MAG: hypothetical protein CM1200mP10_10110 [Candidatus Neomarinimicrobiota bacterium]